MGSTIVNEMKESTVLLEKLLDMFKWFHSFCEQNHLRYFALGGTMLGAIRHKGFIPWDDDIDVGMPRKDYEKFISLCEGKLFGNYTVESINSTHEDYFYGYVKVYDISNTLIEKTRVNIKRGIYIDVFPLDGVCNDVLDVEKVFKPIFYKYQLLVARTCAIIPRRAWYKNAIVILVRMIPNFIINNKRLLREIDTMCKMKDYDECLIVGNILGNWGIKEVMPKKILGTPTLYPFEDTYIYGAENYNDYLVKLYGDWKQLPPIEKRVSHHDSVKCDLNKSYLE